MAEQGQVLQRGQVADNCASDKRSACRLRKSRRMSRLCRRYNWRSKGRLCKGGGRLQTVVHQTNVQGLPVSEYQLVGSNEAKKCTGSNTAEKASCRTVSAVCHAPQHGIKAVCWDVGLLHSITAKECKSVPESDTAHSRHKKRPAQACH